MLRIANDALTFDDVLLLPALSHVLPSEVDLKTRLTRTITLNIPLMSAAMDTVTEWRLAVAMAQEGGIGIVHKNMTIEQQAREVRAVKKFESGIIRDPITITPDRTVGELLEADERAQHLRRSGRVGTRTRRHRHESRRSLRAAHGRQDLRSHDAQGQTGDGA